MTVGESIKLLESKGFRFSNQTGNHMKYKLGNQSITIVKHKSNKELVHKKTEKLINEL